jgi:hypothetical protein
MWEQLLGLIISQVGNQGGKPSAASMVGSQGSAPPQADPNTFMGIDLDDPEVKMGIEKLMAGGGGANTYSGMAGGQAPDMSQYASLPGLMAMANQRPAQQVQNRQVQAPQMNAYIQSLLGG